MLQTVRLDGLVIAWSYFRDQAIQLEDKKLLYREVLDNTLEKATI
jgi:hypothetical protein